MMIKYRSYLVHFDLTFGPVYDVSHGYADGIRTKSTPRFAVYFVKLEVVLIFSESIVTSINDSSKVHDGVL